MSNRALITICATLAIVSSAPSYDHLRENRAPQYNWPPYLYNTSNNRTEIVYRVQRQASDSTSFGKWKRESPPRENGLPPYDRRTFQDPFGTPPPRNRDPSPDRHGKPLHHERGLPPYSPPRHDEGRPPHPYSRPPPSPHERGPSLEYNGRPPPHDSGSPPDYYSRPSSSYHDRGYPLDHYSRSPPPPHHRNPQPDHHGGPPPPHNRDTSRTALSPHDRGSSPDNYGRPPPPHDRDTLPGHYSRTAPSPHDRGSSPDHYGRPLPPHDRGHLSDYYKSPPPHDRGSPPDHFSRPPPTYGRGPHSYIPTLDRGPPPYSIAPQSNHYGRPSQPNQRGSPPDHYTRPPYEKGLKSYDKGPPITHTGFPSLKESNTSNNVKEARELTDSLGHIYEKLSILSDYIDSKNPSSNHDDLEGSSSRDSIDIRSVKEKVEQSQSKKDVEPEFIIDTRFSSQTLPVNNNATISHDSNKLRFPPLFQVVPVTPEK